MASTSKSAIPIAAYSDRSLKETYQLVTVQAPWSKSNFSFQFIVSYVWYTVENLACDLLFGLKFV